MESLIGKSTQSAKLQFLLNQSCDLDVLQDLESPNMYDKKHQFKPFRMSAKGVCRAYPGFARVCLFNLIHRAEKMINELMDTISVKTKVVI